MRKPIAQVTRKNIVEFCEEYDGMEGIETVLLLDGRDAAFVGLQADGMTHEQAREFFEFNIAGAYVGEQTPLLVETFTKIAP